MYFLEDCVYVTFRSIFVYRIVFMLNLGSSTHPVSGSRLCDNKGSAMGNVQIVLAHAKIKGEYVLHIYLTQMLRLL